MDDEDPRPLAKRVSGREYLYENEDQFWMLLDAEGNPRCEECRKCP